MWRNMSCCILGRLLLWSIINNNISVWAMYSSETCFILTAEVGKWYCSTTTLDIRQKVLTIRIFSVYWTRFSPHANYSTEVVPSHYFSTISIVLTSELAYEHFNEIEKALIILLSEKRPSFFCESIRQLPARWSKVIENNGDYSFNIKCVLFSFINEFWILWKNR